MVGQELVLLSIAGVEPVSYKWPLVLGKGNIRGAEDEHDQANEIIDSIRWVCEDHPEIHTDVAHRLNNFDRNNFDNMNDIVEAYNDGVKKLLADEKSATLVKSRLGQRTSRIMLKHIIQQVYNTAISDPNELNHYEPFTPEVYGETSFDLISQMIDLISPITSDMKFIDLGSGVGQVVLQVSALIECELCVGIEKATIPSQSALQMDILFQQWMGWYGKKYSPYRLYHGDFLTPEHRKTISESTIVFVNNFAFGPEVDHMLKERFADLNNGARIVSSKPFCPLNFRITERNLSDIGTIMHVSVMDPLKGSVSWTDKPVSYYLHQIDSSKLERYFIRQQSHNTRNSRSGRHHNILDDRDASSNGSWAVSRDSRASSMEKEGLDPDSPNLASTNSGEDSDPSLGPRGKPRRGRPNKKKFTKKRTTPRPEPRVAKVSQFLESLEVTMTGGDSGSILGTTPDTESGPTSRSDTPPATEDASDTVASSRPVRAAVVNAAAISEAQAEILSSLDVKTTGRRVATKLQMRGRGRYKHLNEGDRLPRSMKTVPGLGGRKKALRTTDLDALDMLHASSIKEIDECNSIEALPAVGCINDKLSVQEPTEVNHEELPLHVYTADGQQIPYGLHVLLDNMKRQYLKMVTTMQSPDYGDGIKEEIEKEKERKEQLTRRVKQLENQIDNLIQDSLGLLKARLRELGISATTPTDFIERAKGIVCSHNDLQKKRGGLETEIRKLETDQEQLIARKEKEILDSVLASKSGSNQEVNLAELRAMVKNDIRACLEDTRKVEPESPLPKVGSDVTLTKVPGEKVSRRSDEVIEVRRLDQSPRLEDEVRKRAEEEARKKSEDDRRRGEEEHRRRVVEEERRRTEEGERRRREDEEGRRRFEEEGRRTNSDHSSPGSYAIKKTMAAPKAQDDYEDRFKKIITSELARAGDRERNQELDREINKMPLEQNRPKVTLSPTKTRPPYSGPEHRDLQDPRTTLDPRTSFIPNRGGAKDPRQIQDPRIGQEGRPPIDPRGRSVDPRALMDPRLMDPRSLMDHRSRLDPRALMDPRTGQDPRSVQDPRATQDPRTVQDSRSVQDSRVTQDPRSVQDSRVVQDPRTVQDSRGGQESRIVQDPRTIQDPRIQDPRVAQSQRPTHQDSRLLSPPDPRARPDSHDSSQSSGDSKTATQSREQLPRDNRDGRSMAEHINNEIERSLMGGSEQKKQAQNVSSSSNALSSQHVINMSVERAIHNHTHNASSTRLSKVIEESVRKDVPPEKTSIYATNRPNPPPADQMEGLACPRGATSSPGDRRPIGAPLPQVEGLASRFDSFFEKEKQAATTREGFAGRFSSPDICNSRPTSTGSKSSLHTPDPGDNDRKRPASPLPSPGGAKRREVTSAASSTSGGDNRGGSGGDETRRWQDEISMGFDRLVAMASEVDKRRKSAENSPIQDGSPRKSASELRLPESQDSMAMKFKVGLMGAQGSSGEDRRRDDDDRKRRDDANSSFPGEKLPEHHFKKKYFNAEFQRQQGEQERREGNKREEDEERRREGRGVQGQGPPRDPRYEQAMRTHYENQGSQRQGPHQEQQGPRLQGPHYRGVPYTDAPRQRPQMYSQGPPQGYPGGPPPGPPDQSRGDFGPRGHPMGPGPHHRGPPPPQGPQGYPPHYNPQLMQAMAYRHQMMYGGVRPPHPGPPPKQ